VGNPFWREEKPASEGRLGKKEIKETFSMVITKDECKKRVIKAEVGQGDAEGARDLASVI